MEASIFQNDIVEQIRENNKLLKDLLTTISDRMASAGPSAVAVLEPQDRSWISGVEAAEYLGLNYVYFMNIIRHQQRFATKRDGRKVLFSMEQLEAYKHGKVVSS